MNSAVTPSPPPVLRLDGLRKAYGVGTPLEVEVLHGIDLTLQGGEFAALIGPSGSGKSTLLNLIGLLDTPTRGEIHVQGRPTVDLNDTERTALRGRSLGFVFQFHHLINAFSVIDNVMMPALLGGAKPDAATRERALELLDAVGLAMHAHKRPTELSGGQQQRVAIARALMIRPPILLADEPTGNLDSRAADEVFALFRRFNQSFGCAVLLVTHDPRIAARCDRVLEMLDGRLVADRAQTAQA
ncbi:MAG: ABC transporter ATP-binding protein [Thiomonas sp.]|uniref:ABC transporter ATP-binding protein n=1 Tax=Thiomonas arsenitoxydans (strain DSM 22701 / CIP 110005 / 3As) TaxID=426114 RepID=D6CN85_THIA3|nr:MULTISPECIES: ABC transporter ATP-binding protein [Thiomonas]MDE1979021.1 ABC transporter ATP-binding protein [Betaproteobacteria bacterium]MBN8744181.1 ABC transporter ATP-binding protein [Thiomonas arsenitoxydans]MDE2175086.1 ABC transporter ATP-binding protein [Betaproteobacteria bacterium]MDE2268412.1 ABC transporter ATP-binding protein [Betaproteobacteria bacterium]ODU95419.1 MAG: ABC transporter ATP-binding protein [Thiomonas sp. SCN 64-16]